MTVADLLHAALRRWYVTLAGLLATGAVLTSMTPAPVYWTSQTVSIIAPTRGEGSIPLGQPDSDPIPAAEILASLVDRGSEVIRSVSPATTLYGEGLYNSTSARIVDVGTQWVSQIPNADIEVESTAMDPSQALQRQQAEVARIGTTLDRLQQRFDVPTTARMTVRLTPTVASVVEVRGSRARSAAVTALLGCILTLMAVYAVERRSPRPRRAPSMT